MKSFLSDYLAGLNAAAEAIPTHVLEDITGVLKAAHQAKARIFVIGNGGSAATASHFACDLGKNTAQPGKPRFKVIALTDSIPAITAYGNDNGYASVFREQLVNLMEPGDVVFAISASGNSPNVVEAIDYARENGATVIGLAGFDGGQLALKADHAITIPAATYEQIEDLQLVLTHVIVSWFKANLPV
ncbi:MAG: SIS domain-containing protein [Puniceicoccaceae bacterium]